MTHEPQTRTSRYLKIFNLGPAQRALPLAVFALASAVAFGKTKPSSIQSSWRFLFMIKWVWLKCAVANCKLILVAILILICLAKNLWGYILLIHTYPYLSKQQKYRQLTYSLSHGPSATSSGSTILGPYRFTQHQKQQRCPPATLSGFDQNWAIHHMMSKRNQCPTTIFPAFCNLKKKNKKRKRMCPSNARTASGGGS